MISVRSRGNGELERRALEGSQEGIGGETGEEQKRSRRGVGEELGWGMRYAGGEQDVSRGKSNELI